MKTLSRRTFFGSSAKVMSAASLGAVSAATLTAGTAFAAGKEAPQKMEKDIRVGMLTAPLGKLPFVEVLDMAKRCNIAALELISGPGNAHLDPMTFGQADADNIKKLLAKRELEISSLANYMNITKPGSAEEVQGIAKKLIDAAVLLNVPTICMITGMAVEKMTKIDTIKQVVAPVFRPILDYAKDKGIRVAVENWFETCLQGLDTFDCLMETIPDDLFGLNYDPSHLYHQQCNHLVPVLKYGKRIFHTHAKDCLVNINQRDYVGVLGKGWWRYVIPGYGNINWGEYISHLRKIGYKGVLSIEHEDSTFSHEEGFQHGARYLNQYC